MNSYWTNGFVDRGGFVFEIGGVTGGLQWGTPASRPAWLYVVGALALAYVVALAIKK